jgi:hypothetical protein
MAMKLNLQRSGPFIGLSGLAVALFLYGYVAIAFPSWVHSAVLPGIWLAFFVLACAWFTTRPYLVLVLPVVAIAVWFVVLLSGG